jgi:hypothetical protein
MHKFQHMSSSLPKSQKIQTVRLTFLVIRFIWRLFFHHVITASGREPDDLHSTSYRLSADTCLSLVVMCTATGFTVNKQKQEFHFNGEVGGLYIWKLNMSEWQILATQNMWQFHTDLFPLHVCSIFTDL